MRMNSHPTRSPRGHGCAAGRRLAAAAALVISPFAAPAYDFTDRFSVSTTVTGVVQHGDFSGAATGDTTRAAAAADLEASLRPTERNEFAVAASFAGGERAQCRLPAEPRILRR